MKMKSMITGVSMAIAAGTVAYAVTEATSSEKKMLKSRTGRAIRAIGDVMGRHFNDDEIALMAGAYHGGNAPVFLHF